MTQPGAVCSVQRLTKRYAGRAVVEDLSFDLLPGTVTGFLGPNGAGKSTTLRMLLGLTRPDNGTATVLGHPYEELSAPARHIGALLESNDFHPGRSGRDHLRILAAQSGIARRRVDVVLGQVGLTSAAGHLVRTYSLGMRQRLGLAGALLGTPNLLILDEPANGLDPAGVAWLRQLTRGFANEGGTVLVSSHLLAELAQSVDRILIISEGRLLADQRLDELQAGGRTLEEVYLALTGEGFS